MKATFRNILICCFSPLSFRDAYVNSNATIFENHVLPNSPYQLRDKTEQTSQKNKLYKFIKGRLLTISIHGTYKKPLQLQKQGLILRTAKRKHGQFSVRLSTKANSKQNYLLDLYTMIPILPINLSLPTGVVQDNIKIMPVFKKNDPKIFSNYRPISVLSVSRCFFSFPIITFNHFQAI